MHMSFSLVGPLDFCPFVLHQFFFHQVLMWEKHIIIYLFSEWFYIAWKQEYTFVLCLLPTWASNM